MVKLKRAKQHMPSFVSDALKERGLEQAYRDRPPYQGNDYLWWLNDAKQDATKQRRLSKMLNNLRQGHGYMGMKWNNQVVQARRVTDSLVYACVVSFNFALKIRVQCFAAKRKPMNDFATSI